MSRSGTMTGLSATGIMTYYYGAVCYVHEGRWIA
jgi:hypothetical protein